MDNYILTTLGRMNGSVHKAGWRKGCGWPSWRKGKGKVHPRTDHEGSEVESKYSFTLSLTSALDGVAVQRHAPAVLPPAKDPVPTI